ncbi:hypothetical protein BLOT_007613 [Blomia tropicalis]|nr:hypothetical protein BLOT_007613 [Blomia tropicalis]
MFDVSVSRVAATGSLWTGTLDNECQHCLYSALYGGLAFFFSFSNGCECRDYWESLICHCVPQLLRCKSYLLPFREANRCSEDGSRLMIDTSQSAIIS